MKLETKIILRGTLEDNSKDIKMILDMRKKAEELAEDKPENKEDKLC